tara:strand:- start:664 stop:765 length:102 start_codon:yes stop_codon:yes gene_type:complete
MINIVVTDNTNTKQSIDNTNTKQSIDAFLKKVL